MRSMVAAKLEPVGMHPEFGAALAGFNAIGGTRDKTTLYTDLGFGTTKAFIARGSRLMFARVRLWRSGGGQVACGSLEGEREPGSRGSPERRGLHGRAACAR